ncbi:thioesterase II family protein [Desulfovibrio inopinatus]|uniref:thioesterase II family protein n=1 Tax=Desulfovibrio inopinatus TaxID=102109 RepID=UPI0003F8AC0B|nr:alpha/beta fold hydrolase [Desulfovibrio inopinatus]
MSSWICADVSADAEMRLFCIPYAGAGASLYRSWSHIFSPSIQVCPVQLPGREERLGESCHTTVATLVEGLMGELVFYLDRPYALFGHSMGSKIAFELCRALQEAGHVLPEILVVSACRAPHLPEPAPIHDLPQDDFVSGLKRYSDDVTLLEENPELLELLLPLLRADFLADESYTFNGDGVLPLPIQAFYGTNDPEATLPEVRAWGLYSTMELTLTAVDGNHLFVRDKKDDVVSVLNSQLQNIILKDRACKNKRKPLHETTMNTW